MRKNTNDQLLPNEIKDLTPRILESIETHMQEREIVDWHRGFESFCLYEHGTEGGNNIITGGSDDYGIDAYSYIDNKIILIQAKIPIQDNLKKLQAESINDLSVFVLVTMAKKMEEVTVNLQGPLLFNLEKRLGLQFIIQDGKYSTRHPLFGDKIAGNPSTASAKEIPAEA